MSLGIPIRDIAALALCPEDRAKGARLLDAIVEDTVRRARPLKIVFALLEVGLYTILLLSVFALLIDWREPHGAFSDAAFAGAFFCVVGLLAVSIAWALIQNGSGSYLLRLPGGEGVELLRRLLGDFASQEREARTKDGIVRPRLFRSALAILLFSGRSDQRGWVRSPDGWREWREILTSVPVLLPSVGGAEVKPNGEPEPTEEPEPALENNDPKMQWLVDGTAAEFKASLERFLREAIQPDQVDLYRFVFTIARRELRRGGQRGAKAAAIRRIKAELEERLKRGTGPNGGDPAHVIKNLLRGKRGKNDISRYFCRRVD